MSDQVKLEDCPEILRDVVNAELAKYNEYTGNAEIISCTMLKSTYDENTTYKAYICNLNTFHILTYIETPPDRYKFSVMKDLVTIGEINEILRAAPDYFKYKKVSHLRS
jgi:hypothetical protein